MEALLGFSALFWFVVTVSTFLLPVLAWLAYRRLCGVERALWAINAQLDQISKPFERAQRTTDGHADRLQQMGREIANSMFGRER